MTSPVELSEREIEILKLVATGRSNKEIAQALKISTNTVKVHLRNVFAKIGVLSRTEATLYAIEHHYVEAPGNPPERGEPPRGFFRRYRLAGIAILLAVILIATGLWLDPAGLFDRPNQTVISPSQIPTSVPRIQDLAPLPEARTGMAAAVYENQVYLFAGETTEGIQSSALRFDILRNSWQAIAAKPTAVRDAQAGLLGEKIYIPGGMTPVGETNHLEVYDPLQDRWENGSPLPAPVSEYALAVYNGRLYLFGGRLSGELSDQVLIYDPLDDAWSTGTPLPLPRAFAGAAVLGNRIYLVGGTSQDGPSTAALVYSPTRDQDGSDPWVEQSPLPAGSQILALQSIGDVLFALSREGTDRLSILQYLPQSQQWVPFDELSGDVLAGEVAVATHQGSLYLFGGSDAAGSPLKTSLRYQVIYTFYIPVLSSGQ